MRTGMMQIHMRKLIGKMGGDKTRSKKTHKCRRIPQICTHNHRIEWSVGWFNSIGAWLTIN